MTLLVHKWVNRVLKMLPNLKTSLKLPGIVLITLYFLHILEMGPLGKVATLE
jgi:hypothetical protein